MLSLRAKVNLLIIGIVISASAEHITVPLMLTLFPSIYFIIFVSTVQGCINYGLLLFITSKYQKKSFLIKKGKDIVLKAGILNAFMALFFLYSASPIRTPVVVQSMLLGLTIVPSVILTKFYLKKNVQYQKLYTVPSILLLVASIIIACIPLYENRQSENLWWCLGYFIAVMLMSFDNIMQEKYMTVTADRSLHNKLTFVFYTSVCQVSILILFCWVEIIFGYTKTPWQAFSDSFKVYGTNPLKALFLQFFIWDCLILYLLGLYLNAISTNYNMILTNLTNQSVAIFFTIFPSLNHGIQHSLHLVIISLICNVISVFLWIKGETRPEEIYNDLEEIKIDIKSDEEKEIH